MGLFGWVFKWRKRKESRKESRKKAVVQQRTAECKKLLKLKKFMDRLLETEDYIARSSYERHLAAYNKVIEYFDVLIDSDSIAAYCKRNGMKQFCFLLRILMRLIKGMI